MEVMFEDMRDTICKLEAELEGEKRAHLEARRTIEDLDMNLREALDQFDELRDDVIKAKQLLAAAGVPYSGLVPMVEGYVASSKELYARYIRKLSRDDYYSYSDDLPWNSSSC